MWFSPLIYEFFTLKRVSCAYVMLSCSIFNSLLLLVNFCEMYWLLFYYWVVIWGHSYNTIRRHWIEQNQVSHSLNFNPPISFVFAKSFLNVLQQRSAACGMKQDLDTYLPMKLFCLMTLWHQLLTTLHVLLFTFCRFHVENKVQCYMKYNWCISWCLTEEKITAD